MSTLLIRNMSREPRRCAGFLTVGFLIALCVASSPVDAVPANVALKEETSSVATPLESSQLVASASDRDEGLSPVKPQDVGAPPTLDSDDVTKTGAPGATPALVPPPASEVGDMMKDPYHNVTLSTSDRDEEPAINNETDIVNDPHVNRINKTHEEKAGDSSPVTPLDGSTQRRDETSSVQDSSAAPVTESSTSKAEDATEHEEIEERSEKQPEKMDATEKVPEGGVSLAEVTSPPVLALVSQHDAHDHAGVGRSSSLSHTSQAAAILAGVLVLVALLGYLGLLTWRRVLEKRYGNREMLVNEDDDFKHFEL